ncbi:PAS domain-containing hybrid sensor histidine kinase/response regulator [Xanthobacter flavus]|uniref:PAS domain-containing hybrid sensor histidine kinase/response regulator n=1 Tax=Xanthobacter flavus TaxID=281 RepID=UPI001AE1C4A5|nr:PAS domain-containing hybrid sensor histidine kinase/response regulator [Xanthobacter flavus]MBP2149349.1 Na+/proline symporter/signal transduction histidine kinase [Xanthobacter flavus]
MLQASVVIFVALAYIGLLFAIASYGDRLRPGAGRGTARPMIYSLSLAVYCTSWTFFGSVGLATTQGFDFLTIYLGPIILMTVGAPLFLRVVRLAKANNITSIADFIAARYGKNQGIAALVAIVAIIAAIPYISLQLKAVSASLVALLGHFAGDHGRGTLVGDLALFVACAMAAFAILFGTRHTDATEHQNGLMLAIATESLVKLAAFLGVGLLVTFVIFDGPFALWYAAREASAVAPFERGLSLENWLTMTILSGGAFMLLPRQFHVAVVENKGESEIRRARWLFPLYLVLINLFVVPLALAGMTLFPLNMVDSDVYVLAVPLAAGFDSLALLAFVGGLSAATAMVIVECVAIAIMVSNDLVMPLLLRRRAARSAHLPEGEPREDMTGLLLMVRRVSIFVIVLLAYLYYRTTGEVQLAQIGLLSFAAIAQVGPAFAAGLLWQRATAKGAIAGIVVGGATWAYTLMVPSLAEAGLISAGVLNDGPFGIGLLRPTALLGLTAGPLAHGVAWSLGLNTLALVVVSFLTRPSQIERTQARLFAGTGDRPPARPAFLRWRSSVSLGELMATVERYLGTERARAAFDSYARQHGFKLDTHREADAGMVRHAEHLLASAVGAASSRLVLSLLLRKRAVSTKAALKLLDDASAAIQYNRELLQSAIDHVRQGIAVFDRDLRLVCWNRQFGQMLDLPGECYAVGVPLTDILAAAPADDEGEDSDDIATRVTRRVTRYVSPDPDFSERLHQRGAVIEARSDPMPDGGIAVTFTDITASVEAALALERANETLENRVRERTEELERLNGALEIAKAEADEANLSKTRFLAAASHDILQPLNAARLYATSMVERAKGSEEERLAGNIDASLESVEEILGALLDISRLDSGVMRPEFSAFRIADVLKPLEMEFAPLAREKNLELTFLPCSLAVRSDRRLLRRLLQNLVSNAVKYTQRGRILVGCRRVGGKVRVEVYDTGVGIPRSKHKLVFQEFQRLDQGAKAARGLGLGLSIVERIARVLEHPVALRSTHGKGSAFTVELPVAVSMPEEREAVPSPARRGAQLDGLTILAIDNEPAILDGMQMLLTGWGCDVITAASAQGALEAIRHRRKKPDVALVDYHLDGGHGIEAIMSLRWKLGKIPAVLITADRSKKVRDAARAADMEILNKPLKPAALRAILAHWRIARAAAE